MPIDVHFSERRRAALQRRPLVVRRLRDHARAGPGARALRQLLARRAHRAARGRRPRGGRGGADAGLPVHGARADLPLHARVLGALRAGRAAAARGRAVRLPELGDLLERLGAEGPAFLYEGDVAAAVSELGARARRPAHARGPGRLRGDRARARARDLPGPRGAHQPAALVRRDPDRRRARDPRAARAPARPGRDRRGDRLHQPRARRGVPRRAGHRGLPGALPRQGRARRRGHRGALAARATRPTSR